MMKNMAASVRARLLNRARTERRSFNELLQYYAMERSLYRLSRSMHANRFVLRGALMLPIWCGPLFRTTKHIDVMDRASASADELVTIVRSCLATQVEDDGLRFDPDSVTGQEICLANTYHEARLRFRVFLGTARLNLHLHVGSGDVITPGPQTIVYPSLLDTDLIEPAKLLGYTAETALAEKLQAMVVLDMANTRMKDFLDIWMIIQAQAISGELMTKAVEATFRRRGTPLPQTVPAALTPAFPANPRKQTQWQAYTSTGRVHGSVPELNQVMAQIRSFALPVFQALAQGTRLTAHWAPRGPWQS